MNITATLAPAPSGPPLSGAPPTPSEPPGAPPFESALENEMARTAHAEGQQTRSPASERRRAGRHTPGPGGR